jgi:hypothetical protein
VTIRAVLDGSPAYMTDFLRCLSSAANSGPTFSFSSLNVTPAVTFHDVMPCNLPFLSPSSCQRAAAYCLVPCFIYAGDERGVWTGSVLFIDVDFLF